MAFKEFLSGKGMFLVFMYLCTGFRQNTLVEYSGGYIVGTYDISD